MIIIKKKIVLLLVTLLLLFTSFKVLSFNNAVSNAQNKEIITKKPANSGVEFKDLTSQEREYLYERLLISCLGNSIQQSITEYYRKPKQYENAKIINIKPVYLDYEITIQFKTFTGAHNPPYGLDTITLFVNFPDNIKVTSFVHKDI